MAEPHPPEPVKYFVAVLWSSAPALPDAYTTLAARFGTIDCEGPDRPFDLTNYYETEMGPALSRRLISFAPLRQPDELADAKHACMRMEEASGVPRRVNLDVGYLDHNKIVLASIKPAGQKIYLRDGIYADLVARYAQGHYQPFAWTFPDFKEGRYDNELARMRECYLLQMKALRT